jgi:KEOPS complex subunit Pcc1
MSLLRTPHSLQRAWRCNQRDESPLNNFSGKNTCKITIFIIFFVHIHVRGYPVAFHQATFRFSTSRAQKILCALAPELCDEVNSRSQTRGRLDGPETLVLTIEAQDIAALRAALNMFLRLISVADEMQDIT